MGLDWREEWLARANRVVDRWHHHTDAWADPLQILERPLAVQTAIDLRLPRELKPLRQRVARGLVQKGILAEERSKRLRVLPTTRFPTVDPAPEQQLRERLHGILIAGREPTAQEAGLLGLLDALGLIDSLVARDQRREARRRARVVAEDGLAGPAVRDAIRAVQAAIFASVVAATASSTTAGS